MPLPSGVLDGMTLAAIVLEDRDLSRAGPGCAEPWVEDLRARLGRFDALDPDGRRRALAGLARRLRPAPPKPGPTDVPRAHGSIADPGLRRYLARIGAIPAPGSPECRG
jgi:hypothetical protein